MTAFLLAATISMAPIMPVDSIEKGQRGSCLTVFEGTTRDIEPFDFVVKAVMHHFLGPGKHLILAKLVGEKAEFTGVVAGMSGSPCSIDGKLIGALSYSFAAFAKEPIAGITPMADMLETLAPNKNKRPWRKKAKAENDAGWDALRAGKALAKAPDKGDTLRPIAAPLSLGGVAPAVRRHFSPWLQSIGFLPVAGGHNSSSKAARQGLKPGSAIAAVLATGDVDLAATGTVTSVEGKAVLAFGHPFLGVGSISVPMAEATIVNTMASSQRSFKMSETGALVGEITEDRLTAIGGYLGPVPAMIPVTGEVTTPVGKSTFAFKVARDHAMSPRFVAMGLANALYGRVDVDARGTVRLHGTVRAEGLDPIEVRAVSAGERDEGLLIVAAIDMARTFATLWDTPFGPPPRMSLHVSATIEPEPIVEWIESMEIDRRQARPGDNVSVAVRLRRSEGAVRFERFSLTVPRSWAGQEVELHAANGNQAQALAERMAGRPYPTDVPQIARWLRERRLDGHLYLMATRPGPGLRVRAESMPFLPGSVVATMGAGPQNEARSSGLAWEERRPQPGSLEGGARSKLRVLAH